MIEFMNFAIFVHHIHVNNIETLDAFEGFFLHYTLNVTKFIINERIFGLSTKAETSEN